MRRAMLFLMALALLCGAGSAAPPAAAREITARPSAAGGITPQDVPTALANGITTYTLAAPKIFWNTDPLACPIPLANGTSPRPAVTYPYTETISRIATYGSSVRKLYDKGQISCGAGIISSNLAADANYVYFLTTKGLYRLSTNANPGDAPQLVNALVSGYGEVADGGDRTYYLVNSGNNSFIGYVLKSNNQRVPLTAYGSSAGKLSTDGAYVYYMIGSTLYRLKPGVDSGVPIVNSVSGYYAEGQRSFCLINPPVCFFTNNVYVGQGTTVKIY